MQQLRPRYSKMAINLLGITHLHKRNPWVAMACSTALPGLGHFYCGAYSRGFILMSWEIMVNHFGRINHAIFLTVNGHLEEAQRIVEYRWAVIYPVFYVLAMWNAYRVAVEINKLCELEERQPVREFPAPMTLSFWEIAYMSKRNPWMAAFLSGALGGGGHLYNGKTVKAVMLMGWHLAIWLNSGLNRALLATFRGDWSEVHTVVDYQWLLFWPSIHMFNIWNAYADCVELNKLQEEQVEVYLRQVTGQEEPNYQPVGGTT